MQTLDPVVHQEARLKILACLYRNRVVGFPDLRDGLKLTPGNLQSHLVKLEEAGYIKSGRVLVDLSFEARYRITAAGTEAFRVYLASLQRIIADSGITGVPASDS